MSYRDHINSDKFKQLQKSVYDNAVKHGWHEERLSTQHMMGMIITEVAEAIEADRVGKYADSTALSSIIKCQSESEYGLTEEWYESWFHVYYDEYIKGSVEEEFADIVIRLLDMAEELHGEYMKWEEYYNPIYLDYDFPEHAFYFIKNVLGSGTMNICVSVQYIFVWASILNIDLMKHVEWKMKYNEFREYMHGGKKY